MSLEATGLFSGYREGIDVVTDISFSLSGGAIGFIGRNGAGKSCLAQTLSGALALREGSIVLNGKDVTKQNSRKRVRSGISLVPEGRLVFGQLTVRENLEVAAYAAGKPNKRSASLITRYEEQFPILGQKRSNAAASMSGGEQQLLVIARALIQEPAVVILDEPSLGLSPIAVDNLTHNLQSIVAESNVIMVLMEQNGELLTGLCDQVMLMEQGEIVRSLDMHNKVDQEALEASYLGI